MRPVSTTPDPRIKRQIAAIYALPLAAALLLPCAAHAATIIEFTQPNCPHVAELAATVAALAKHGVVVEARDVTIPANLAQAKRLGAPGTPTVIVNGHMYPGDEGVAMLKIILSIVNEDTGSTAQGTLGK